MNPLHLDVVALYLRRMGDTTNAVGISIPVIAVTIMVNPDTNSDISRELNSGI